MKHTYLVGHMFVHFIPFIVIILSYLAELSDTFN